MAWVVGRKLTVSILSSYLVAACGDDTGAVTGADTSDSDATTSVGSSNTVSDTFESISDSVDTVTDTSPTTFDTTDSDPSISDSDTFETSITTDSDPSISDSDTFDTSITDSDPSDSDTFDTSITDSDSDTQGSSSTTEGSTTTDPTDTMTTDPSLTDPSDSDPSMTDSDPSDSDPSMTDSDPSMTDSDPSMSSTDPSTTTDPTDATSTTDPTDTDPTDTDPTDTETDTDPTGGGGFPPAPPFGTNVLDLDLVGVWGLNWDPESGFDSVIDIDDQGNFMWTESSADCSTETVASGFLWVEGIQVVMHVELWDRQLPWDTEPVTGETYPPPFRLRMSFSLQGSGPDDYLALGAPSRITETAPYGGESYVQVAAQGDFLAGTWHGEAQLDAIPAGESDPVVIVRDTYEALLELELAADDPQGMGTRSVTTQYFPVAQQIQTFDGANWTCLNGCPDPSGVTLVDGSNLYTYGPYAGYQHLLTFETGRTFRAGAVSDCP